MRQAVRWLLWLGLWFALLVYASWVLPIMCCTAR